MKRKSLLAIVLLSSFAAAGTLSGTVQAPGQSAVVLESISAKSLPASAAKAEINQFHLAFNPALLVIQKGTTVTFTNSDSAAHNIFWPSISGDKKLGHNLGTFPKGESRSFKFDNPGYVPLLCNVHPEMSAAFVVSPSPYFASTDANGQFSIADVPDGQYKVTVWHSGKATMQNVTVKGDTALNIAAK
jgi:plastocyanin